MPVLLASFARHRRVVLFAAILIGLAVAGGLRERPAPSLPADLPRVLVAGLVTDAAAAPGVRIRVAPDDESGAEPIVDAKLPGVRIEVAAADPAAKAPAGASVDEPAAKPKRKSGADIGVTIDEDTGRVRIGGVDGGHEFESVETFVQQAPWIAGIVFIVTFFVFLTPILIITLIIWYKVRKTRMLNETMIRLAEKGVVPPAEALEAVAGGRQAAALQTGPTTAPIYLHAKMLRTRAAWSDLRKGIFCAAVGLGLTFYSMLDDGTPNFIGLVLLFVGLGYLLLWYFEDRQIAASAEPPPPPAPPSPPVA